MPNMLSLIAKAPHAEAGKKLIDYLLSAEVERKLAQSEAVQIPLHDGVAPPKNMPAILSLKPMTLDFAATAARVEEVTRPVADHSRSLKQPVNREVGVDRYSDGEKGTDCELSFSTPGDPGDRRGLVRRSVPAANPVHVWLLFDRPEGRFQYG